ncbi:MAG: hypothetical protein NWF08_05445 [Candidatus Bathyarchaeota archaeon]|nr:hypothetical protein [Candidatus Bathyarchaeota archaeon]
MKAKIGEWAFIAFIIIAILAGLAAGMGGGTALGWVTLVMVILGIIVGLTTITTKEASTFLMAAIALLVANGGGIFLVIDQVIAPLGTIINAILNNIAAFVAPAAIILAVKAIIGITKK